MLASTKAALKKSGRIMGVGKYWVKRRVGGGPPTHLTKSLE
jgi:hypothetical protein